MSLNAFERFVARFQAYTQDLAGAFAIMAAGLLPHVFATRLLKDEYGSIERDPNAARSRGEVVPLRRPGAGEATEVR